jgi:hypothetical protein
VHVLLLVMLSIWRGRPNCDRIPHLDSTTHSEVQRDENPYRSVWLTTTLCDTRERPYITVRVTIEQRWVLFCKCAVRDDRSCSIIFQLKKEQFVRAAAVAQYDCARAGVVVLAKVAFIVGQIIPFGTRRCESSKALSSRPGPANHRASPLSFWYAHLPEYT